MSKLLKGDYETDTNERITLSLCLITVSNLRIGIAGTVKMPKRLQQAWCSRFIGVNLLWFERHLVAFIRYWLKRVLL